jgi:protein required for attachment to host cells
MIQMKISDAISQLDQIRKQHGDMEVVVADGGSEYKIKDFGAKWNSKKGDVNQMEGLAQISIDGVRKIIAYARDGNVNRSAPYNDKFAGLIEAIAEAKKDGTEILVVAEPWVIGDTREELTESLSRLAGTEIGLIVLHRKRMKINDQN